MGEAKHHISCRVFQANASPLSWYLGVVPSNTSTSTPDSARRWSVVFLMDIDCRRDKNLESPELAKIGHQISKNDANLALSLGFCRVLI
ncbi:hypothetical protein TNCV_1544371 [Trichonephila clavipes]|nr:hypothetical protein TNCV_1544371 [Trichonephila clavipes]